jgi:hypothetical protein
MPFCGLRDAPQRGISVLTFNQYSVDAIVLADNLLVLLQFLGFFPPEL